MPPQPEAQGVEAYFTNVEELQLLFKNAVGSKTLTRRMLIIHGVGGVGKSSLLRMFSLHCMNVAHVPAALASGDDAKSAVDVLSDWTNDLKTSGVALMSFSKTLEHYRSIQARVDKRGERDPETTVSDIMGKAASKTGEALGGAVIGGAVGSFIPGLGTATGGILGGVIGGMGADALVGRFRAQGLSRYDVDLLRDPAKKMTDDFLVDISRIASTKRLVLMVDTYEQMTALDDWMSDFAHRLHPNILIVIAGREMVNWDRQWQGWLGQADVQMLEPMSPEVMRALVHNYFRTQVGGNPDPVQVEKIIRFSRGLPMAVATAVRLWVKYRVRDFEEVEADALDELVQRLRARVPSQVIPILEAAAGVRYFNKEILRAVAARDDIDATYDELCRFPFVKPTKEGAQPARRLHDSVREFIDRSLQVDDPERFRELHERAASYFEKRLEIATGEEMDRLRLERLYHHMRVNEEVGIKLLQEMAEELILYRFVNRLRALLNDVDTYLPEREKGQLWRDYYMACLLDQEGRWLVAEDLLKNIAQNPNAPNQVRSYALRLWGTYLARPERISKAGGTERAIEVLQSSTKMTPGYDSHTILAAWELGILFERLCQWEKAWQYFNEVKRYASSLGKSYQAAYLKSMLKDPYAKTGNWRELLSLQRELQVLLDELPILSETRMLFLFNWAVGLAWMGRYAEMEQFSRDAQVDLAKINMDTSGIRRDLGLSLAFQDRFEEAQQEFQKGMDESMAWVARRSNFDLDRAVLLHYSFWGMAHVRAGEFRQAQRKLLCAVRLKRKHKDYIGFPELYISLGTVYELLADYLRAQKWHSRCVELQWTGRLNFVCGALAGLVRVKHALGDYDAIPALLGEAEQLAQQYEYNDHLASLRLTQGHIAWEGEALSGHSGYDAALGYYRQALIYSLRYNRFLLDEVLRGRPQGTPLRSIIPYCLERGEEGRKMLFALQECWKAGINDIGTRRPDTISPIEEGIQLLEAERIARKRELGDGSPQNEVLDTIAEALRVMEHKNSEDRKLLGGSQGNSTQRGSETNNVAQT